MRHSCSSLISKPARSPTLRLLFQTAVKSCNCFGVWSLCLVLKLRWALSFSSRIKTFQTLIANVISRTFSWACEKRGGMTASPKKTSGAIKKETTALTLLVPWAGVMMVMKWDSWEPREGNKHSHTHQLWPFGPWVHMDTTVPGEGHLGRGSSSLRACKASGGMLGLQPGTREAGKGTALDNQATDDCYLNKLSTI